LEQTKGEKKGNCHESYADGNQRKGSRIAQTARCRDFHRSFQNELGYYKAEQRNKNEDECQNTHRRSSICAIGFATSVNPTITSPIPHQRRGEIDSPRKIQQPSGTKTSTIRESGYATVRGTYRSTYSQLIKLTTIRRIAHQTRGEARPLIPVQEIALSGSATSVAPRFKRNSDTSTHTTLKL